MASSRCTSLLCLTCALFFLSTCGETQRPDATQAENTQADSAQAEDVQAENRQEAPSGMMTVDSATAARMRADGSESISRVMRVDGSSMDIWLGTLLLMRDGEVVVGPTLRLPESVDLRRDDVIEAINETDVASPAALKEQYQAKSPGDEIRLTIRRAGEPQTVTFARLDSSEAPTLNVTTRPAN